MSATARPLKITEGSRSFLVAGAPRAARTKRTAWRGVGCALTFVLMCGRAASSHREARPHKLRCFEPNRRAARLRHTAWISSARHSSHGSDSPMNESLLQSGRTAEFTTPLGKDVLVLTDFSGSEGLGELFEYHIDALSDKEDINFDDAIGQGCMVKLKTDDGKTRIYHGIMTEARWIGWRDEYCRYRIVLRPWLWLLGHKADCRIFLDKTVKDIIQEVFSKAGFSDFEFRTSGSYDKIEYCVQYRESDLAFVCRLMEHYGIYYFFEPSDGKHTLVMADSRSSHKPIADLPKVRFNTSPAAYDDKEQSLS